MFFVRLVVENYPLFPGWGRRAGSPLRDHLSLIVFFLFCFVFFFKEPKRVLLNARFDTSIFRSSFYHRRHSTSQSFVKMLKSMGSLEPQQRELYRHALPPTRGSLRFGTPIPKCILLFATSLRTVSIFVAATLTLPLHKDTGSTKGPSLDILRYALLVCQSFEKRVGRDTVWCIRDRDFHAISPFCESKKRSLHNDFLKKDKFKF